MFSVLTKVRGSYNMPVLHPPSYYASLAWKAPNPGTCPIHRLLSLASGPFNL